MHAKTPELLPCPFCGGEARYSPKGAMQGYGYLANVKCLECSAVSEAFENDEDAITGWNSRVNSHDDLTGALYDMYKIFQHTPEEVRCGFDSPPEWKSEWDMEAAIILHKAEQALEAAGVTV